VILECLEVAEVGAIPDPRERLDRRVRLERLEPRVDRGLWEIQAPLVLRAGPDQLVVPVVQEIQGILDLMACLEQRE